MLKQSVAQTGCPTIARAAVVCPSSLVFNWQAEFGKWLGRERISTVPISAACKDVKREIEDFLDSRLHSVIIISYELYRCVRPPDTCTRVAL